MFMLFIHYSTLSIQLLFTDESFVREGTFKTKEIIRWQCGHCAALQNVSQLPLGHTFQYTAQIILQFHSTRPLYLKH